MNHQPPTKKFRESADRGIFHIPNLHVDHVDRFFFQQMIQQIIELTNHFWVASR